MLTGTVLKLLIHELCLIAASEVKTKLIPNNNMLTLMKDC